MSLYPRQEKRGRDTRIMKTMFNGEWKRDHRNVTKKDFDRIKEELSQKPVNVQRISEELQWSTCTIRKVQSCKGWPDFQSKNEEVTSMWQEMSSPVDIKNLRKTFHIIKNLKMNLILLSTPIDTEADLDGSSDILYMLTEAK